MVDLEQAGVKVSSYAQDMMSSRDFKTLSVAEMVDTVRLKVQDLGLSGFPTTDEIYKRAQELGLDLCPAELGPQYSLQYVNQPLREGFYIGMKPLADSKGNPRVFNLERSDDGLWLRDCWAGHDDAWHPEWEVVFRLRKAESQKSKTLSSLLKALTKR